MRTYSPKPSELQRVWRVVDADGLVLGRLSTEVASVLRGKHRPIFAPHLDTGDHVIVVNAAKIVMTAGKSDRSFSYRHSGYPGGLRTTSYAQELETRPEEVVRRCDQGHAPQGRPRSQDARQAEGLRRAGAPPRRADAHSARPARRPAGLLDPKDRSFMAKPLVQSTGRRKRAVARVRLRTGEGAITINARPSRTTSPPRRTARSRPSRCGSPVWPSATTWTPRSTGVASPVRRARSASASPAGLIELDGELAAEPEEGRHAHPRRPREGEQEVRA